MISDKPDSGVTQVGQKTAPLMTANDLHVSLSGIPILQGVSLDLAPGSILVMLGRNGAGKTTTLRSLMGLNDLSSGSVTFFGDDISDLRPHERARLGMGYVPEDRAIFSDLSVEENLRIAERSRGDFERSREEIYEIFPDLSRLSKISGTQLSGGQQQMLAIARVLVPENRLLIVDEPFEGLAPVIVDQLMLAFEKIAQDKTVLLVEQNFRAAAQIAEEYVLVADGQSIGTGRTAKLMEDQESLESFLGVK